LFLIQELKEKRQISRAELYSNTYRKNGHPIDDYNFEKKMYVAFFLLLVY
jgi:hypothetical protein